jgi:hypothetical protein
MMKIERLKETIILNKATQQIYRIGKVMDETVEFLNPITGNLEGLFFIDRLKNNQWVRLREDEGV